MCTEIVSTIETHVLYRIETKCVAVYNTGWRLGRRGLVENGAEENAPDPQVAGGGSIDFHQSVATAGTETSLTDFPIIILRMKIS